MDVFSDAIRRRTMARRLDIDITAATTREEAILASLRFNHGHAGHEQTCGTCVLRARTIDRVITLWEHRTAAPARRASSLPISDPIDPTDPDRPGRCFTVDDRGRRCIKRFWWVHHHVFEVSP